MVFNLLIKRFMVVGLKVLLWSIRDSYSSFRNHICLSNTLRELSEEACFKSNLYSWRHSSNKRGDNFWDYRMIQYHSPNQISYLFKSNKNYLSPIFNKSLQHPSPKKVPHRLSSKTTHPIVKRATMNWNSTTRSSGNVCRVRTLSKFKNFIIKRKPPTTTKILETQHPSPILIKVLSKIIKELHRTTRCLHFSTLKSAHNNFNKLFSTRLWSNHCLKSNLGRFLSRQVLCSDELTLATKIIQAASIKAATYGLVYWVMCTSQ